MLKKKNYPIQLFLFYYYNALLKLLRSFNYHVNKLHYTKIKLLFQRFCA